MNFRKRATVQRGIIGTFRRWLSDCECYRVTEVKRDLAGERGRRVYYAEHIAPVWENGDPLTGRVTDHVWKIISTHKIHRAAEVACVRHLNSITRARGEHRAKLEV